MQVFSSRKRKIEAAAMILTVTLISFFSYELISASIPTDPEKVAAIIGPWGPPGILATQFAQVLIAPLPPVTPVISGMLYGPVSGTFYSFLGAAAGTLVAILIARRYGRPGVEKFLSGDALTRFDKYTSGHGYLPFVVLFVFPGFPDDALCFIAGLTRLDWKKLFLLASIGRIPGIALLAVTGSSAAQAETTTFLLSAGAVLTISIISVKYERQLEELVAYVEEESISLLGPVWNQV